MKQLFTLLLAIPMLTTFSQYTTKSVQTSNANEDEDTGKLTWKFNLDSSELKAYELSYTIRYPKNKRVVTSKQFRTISCPSF